jgi:Arrestin (or S-antigen), N-terminal domain
MTIRSTLLLPPTRVSVNAVRRNVKVRLGNSQRPWVSRSLLTLRTGKNFVEVNLGFPARSHFPKYISTCLGTYTYPVSFAIPATSPPTVHCDYGAVRYHLKAVVHRPGALTPKLVTTREVTIVASPSEDDTEETHSIIVERQWDDQLRYLIALSGRSFVIGSQVPFNLTMIPMEKCKIYKLAVFLEGGSAHCLWVHT